MEFFLDNIYFFSSISDNTETERMEIFFKYVTEIASCSYQNMNNFENFTKYDWLPKYAFKDIAYKVKCCTYNSN